MGHEVKFIAEGFADKSQETKGGPPRLGRQDDKQGKKGSWEKEDLTGKKRIDKFDRHGKIDKEQDSNHGDNQEAIEEECSNDNL
jgi:hypothetical protein